MKSMALEVTLLKWTFGLVFGGVVLIFAGKVLAVVLIAAKLKIAALQVYLASGHVFGDAGGWLWEALQKAVTGGK